MLMFLRKQSLLKKLISYAEDHNVKINQADLKVSSALLQTQLEAYIVRNFFDNEGFCPIINTTDKTIDKALEIFRVKP